MNLSSRLAREFDDPVKKRGQGYYRQGAVRIVSGSASAVEARVQGSSSYLVNLDWEDEVLHVLCECPYFVSDGPCKHIWATIMAADARGLLSLAAQSPRLSLADSYDPDFDDDDDDDDDDYSDSASFDLRKLTPHSIGWRRHFEDIENQRRLSDRPSDVWPSKRQIIYLIDVAGSKTAGNLVLSLAQQDRKADGTWGRRSALALKQSQLRNLPAAEDREIIALLAGTRQYSGWGFHDSYDKLPESLRIVHPLATTLVRLATSTGRCFLQKSRGSDLVTKLNWDDGEPWRLGLSMNRGQKGGWAVTGHLHRSEERMELSVPALITMGGLVFTETIVAPLAEDTSFEWLAHLHRSSIIAAPEEDQDELLATLLSTPGLPPVDVPEELKFEEITESPKPTLHIYGGNARSGARLRAELTFHYGDRVASANDVSRGFYDCNTRRFLRRDLESEKSAANLLSELGAKPESPYTAQGERGWEIASGKLPRLVRGLVESGWHVEADGRIFRRPGATRAGVSSGVDWFELHGQVEYGDTTAQLPELLKAVRRGDHVVQLDDGTFGVLPEEWLARLGTLAGMGTAEDDHIRFGRSQAGLLDALLATQPEVDCDATFTRVRQELQRFGGIQKAEQPAGFVGTLRDYQLEGVGWMEFLRRFSFGGCLADDMGVGKTAQVLAVLETRRALRAAGESIKPSLVVVPKSLVFNWKQESARFTPCLRVLDYTGIARAGNDFGVHDIVLTTYGTLRRDAIHLKDFEFDYIVLDEAQAIKNAGSESAKAVHLLRGQHRLAVSGTPVENHLGELWSIFEFLNPGMLGAASVFRMTGGAARNPDEETRRLLAHALRPFILRRTKEQVARELPPKTEQTIFCEMEPPQRKLYNELKQHYRDSLLKRVATQGLAKSKMHVLEALLRLRQAACHPGLLDDKRIGDPSAKLGVLLEQINEVIEGGHKALVFSQFTSLLRIVRDRLDRDGVVYEYLDGSTRDRQARVERFQNDASCPLFLISLKAGGLGLNLTAAEYVFLLDPWWNPAVEAQAVDRAHRIGQERHVFAYRLIARETVEEKVLELQKTKRDLASAIISEDNSLIRDLKREDLELLLS